MLTHKFLASNVYSDNFIAANIPTNMDSNRNCLRRRNHRETEFSNQSIMKTMEKFVQAVQEMDETILVPCRLMDLEVGDAGDTVGLKGVEKRGERDPLTSTDLYELYSLVNCVRTELLWGANNVQPEAEATVPAPVTKSHMRRPSTASLISTNSASTISDTDSETGNENDSGIEADNEQNNKSRNYTQKIEESFRRHLYGLHHSLKQMTEAAEYLSKRYQNDVGGVV